MYCTAPSTYPPHSILSKCRTHPISWFDPHDFFGLHFYVIHWTPLSATVCNVTCDGILMLMAVCDAYGTAVCSCKPGSYGDRLDTHRNVSVYTKKHDASPRTPCRETSPAPRLPRMQQCTRAVRPLASHRSGARRRMVWQPRPEVVAQALGCGVVELVRAGGRLMSTRCLFHKYTTSSPGFSLGAPRSSVASGAGLEPGAPRRALAQDLRNGHTG